MAEEKANNSLLPKIVGAVVFVMFFWWGYNEFSLDFLKSNETLVQEAVSQIKETTKIPKQIDDNTTWVGITAKANAIHYDYTLSGIDTTDLNNSTLKQFLSQNICNNTELVDLMSKDINLEYSYKDLDTNKTYFVVFTESDCF